MAQKLMTPGVYIEEVNAFPGSVVEVETAIPAFIGYTEKASRNGKSLINQPVRITSHAEYQLLFGGAFNPSFTLDAPAQGQKSKNEITINSAARVINYKADHVSYMYRGLQLFFNNGGGTCYIVSVGTYEGKNKVDIIKKELEDGILTLLKEQEPTMVLIPDAVKLKDECYDVYKKVLAHCAKMQSRVAILDIHNGDQSRDRGDAPGDIITNFRELIGTEYLNYAAAYYPWLNTNIVQKGEITFENLDPSVKLGTLLPELAAIDLVNNFPKDNAGFIEKLLKDKPKELQQALSTDKGNRLTQPVKPTVITDPTIPVEPKKEDTDLNGVQITDAVFKGKVKQYDLDTKAYAKNKTDYDNYVILKAAYDIANPVYEIAKPAYENFDRAETAFAASKPTDATYDSLKTDYLSKLGVLLDNKELEAVQKLLSDYIINKNLNYHQGLVATSATYSNLLDEIRGVMNLLPPSTAMAGIYTMVDNNRGVWKSPANISLNSVVKPSTNIIHDEQRDLNVDAVSGKSINAIRTFPGIGTLVWGARTLDGNSLDWKYINVRRTMIMLEQSIKLALRSYVFEPNDANTWVTVRSMIVNFLTEKWKQGALAGASPDDAFDVQIGLGATMTGLDILEGKMLVSVKLAIVRPAEFIVVTFEQQMQKS